MEWKIILSLFLILCIVLYLYLRLRRKFKELQFKKRSQSSRYGKISEQFMPFLEDYPYEPQDFRFLGTPIDGVQFGEDKVTFIEFKSANSQLSQKQRHVRDLIEEGKVDFEVHRIN